MCFIYILVEVAGAVADLFVGLLRAMPALDNDEMLLVEACVKGDLDTVKRIVDRSPEKVKKNPVWIDQGLIVVLLSVCLYIGLSDCPSVSLSIQDLI